MRYHKFGMAFAVQLQVGKAMCASSRMSLIVCC